MNMIAMETKDAFPEIAGHFSGGGQTITGDELGHLSESITTRVKVWFQEWERLVMKSRHSVA